MPPNKGPEPGEVVVRLLLVMVVLLGACAADAIHRSKDFDRHRYSRLVQPHDRPGEIYFDVTFTADYPADDPAADNTRLAWLQGWMDQRRLCPAGHEVARRRPFDYLEDNPAGYQERWEVRCLGSDPTTVPTG
jgi:hypothetical protein